MGTMFSSPCQLGVDEMKLYQIPNTLEELFDLLRETDERFFFAAGTTALGRRKIPKQTMIIDLSALHLNYISKSNGTIRIGAMTTASEISRSNEFTGVTDALLRSSAKLLGDSLIRNRVTIGGNIVQAYRWSHFPPVLLALDSHIHLASPDGERRLSGEDFISGSPRKVLREKEFVKEIEIPIRTGKGSFSRFSRTRTEFSWITLAICLGVNGNGQTEARVATGGIESRSRRLKTVEECLNTEEDSLTQIQNAMKAMKSDIRPSHSNLASIEYRTEIFGVMLQRELEQLLEV